MINAVLFGALAGSGVLPLPRAACEDVIRKGGRGAEASLKGFALGYSHACGEVQPADPEELKRWRNLPSERVRNTFPARPTRSSKRASPGSPIIRTATTPSLYLDRLAPIAKLEREQGGGANGFPPPPPHNSPAKPGASLRCG